MARINWKLIMKTQVREALDFFKDAGIKPNLRTLFYRLVSMNVIPNNINSYKGLSRQLVKYRKNGTFAWDCIEDRARQTYGDLKDYVTPPKRDERYEEELKQKLAKLSIKELLREYMDYLKPDARVDFWGNQNEVCEIWIEKEALTTTLQSFTSDLGVKIRPNRGYSSWTFLKDAVNDLRIMLHKHDRVHILYLGDLDPSGVDIDRYIKEVFEFFGLDYNRVTFERICVTVEQVDKYGLPAKPEDSATLAKLARDPRTANYEYDYVVELDALLAFVPEQFREIVRAKIQNIHNSKIYFNLKANAEIMQENIDTIHEEYKEKCRAKMLTELT